MRSVRQQVVFVPLVMLDIFFSLLLVSSPEQAAQPATLSTLRQISVLQQSTVMTIHAPLEIIILALDLLPLLLVWVVQLVLFVQLLEKMPLQELVLLVTTALEERLLQ